MERQSASKDCAEIDAASAGTLDLYLSVLPAILQISEMKGTNRPWYSSLNFLSEDSVLAAPAKAS